jgi:transcriptional regulator with XRE-family HTH domain
MAMDKNFEQLAAIAMRIRELRDISGLAAADVAARAGITPDDYEAYEAGKSDFSFSHLFNIAKVLGVDISDLLTGESPRLHGYILTRADEGLEFHRRDQYVYHHLAYNFKDKLAEPFIVTVSRDEKNAAKQAHSHAGQEFDYVLEGVLRIVLGGRELFLRAGDSVYYDSSLPHAMYAPEGDCRFIAVVIKEGAK